MPLRFVWAKQILIRLVIFEDRRKRGRGGEKLQVCGIGGSGGRGVFRRQQGGFTRQNAVVRKRVTARSAVFKEDVVPNKEISKSGVARDGYTAAGCSLGGGQVWSGYFLIGPDVPSWLLCCIR